MTSGPPSQWQWSPYVRGTTIDAKEKGVQVPAFWGTVSGWRNEIDPDTLLHWSINNSRATRRYFGGKRKREQERVARFLKRQKQHGFSQVLPRDVGGKRDARALELGVDTLPEELSIIDTSRLKMRLWNVVVKFRLKGCVEVNDLANFHLGNFNMITRHSCPMRYDTLGNRVNALIFNSKKAVCTGSKHPDQAETAVANLALLLSRNGIIVHPSKIEVHNLVGSFYCPKVSLRRLRDRYPTIVQYFPEIFPNAVYYSDATWVALIPHKGIVIITGAKSIKEIAQAGEHVRELLQPFFMTDAEEREFDRTGGSRGQRLHNRKEVTESLERFKDAQLARKRARTLLDMQRMKVSKNQPALVGGGDPRHRRSIKVVEQDNPVDKREVQRVTESSLNHFGAFPWLNDAKTKFVTGARAAFNLQTLEGSQPAAAVQKLKARDSAMDKFAETFASNYLPLLVGADHKTITNE